MRGNGACFEYIFQLSQPRVAVQVSGTGSAVSLGSSRYPWICGAQTEPQQQPQTLCVTLILWPEQPVPAWLTVPMGYVGQGL